MTMDAFELNKIAGGVLFALLVFFAARTVSDIIFTIPVPAEPGYEVAVEEDAGHAPEEAEAAVSLPKLLQEASAEKGASVAKKCAACHTFEQGGANKVGPNLHGIVGGPIASHEGFAYSPAMQEYKNEQGTWSYDALYAYLENPKAAVPGTKMAFAGVKSDTQRADLLLYLREESPEAPPLPEMASEVSSEPGPGAPATTDDTKPAPAEPAPPAATEPAAPAQSEPAPPAASEPAAPAQSEPVAPPADGTAGQQ